MRPACNHCGPVFVARIIFSRALSCYEILRCCRGQVRPPMPPRYFFAIDVSHTAVQSGSLPIICAAIKDSLETLPGNERTQVGFLTFDSTLHFYNLKSSLSQPQMLVRPMSCHIHGQLQLCMSASCHAELQDDDPGCSSWTLHVGQ